VSKLLVVDVGNTTTRLGTWEEGGLTCVRFIRSADLRSVADVDALAHALAEKAALDLDGAGVVVCSVVPAATALWLDWGQRTGPEPFLITGRSNTPLQNRYRSPEQLGPDRLAAAVGAVRRVGAPVIVVSLGTATVVDAVSHEGRFLGGAIAVGVETGLEALAERTAALPRASLAAPERPFGGDTEECLRVGAVLGTAALVEGLAARLQGAVGEGAAVALTGGYAEIVSPHLLIEHEVFPDLVLEGAALIWEHNAGEG